MPTRLAAAAAVTNLVIEHKKHPLPAGVFCWEVHKVSSTGLQEIRRWRSNRAPAEWAVLVPFGVFCFVYPFAMLLLSLDLMPFGMEWMSSLLLAMLGISAGAWLWLNFGGRGASLAVGIFLAGLLLEYVGVSTGVPFGRYRYTGVLVPGLPGGVPLAIGFAWLFIIVAGLFAARWLLARNAPARVVLLASVGALLAVGLDLLLEPVAFHVKGYWLWQDPSPGYYGVPWSNFAAWFVAALILNLVVLGVLRPAASGHPRMPWLPVVLYLMNAVLFGVVTIANGLWAPGFVCLALLLAFYFAGPRVARQSRA